MPPTQRKEKRHDVELGSVDRRAAVVRPASGGPACSACRAFTARLASSYAHSLAARPTYVFGSKRRPLVGGMGTGGGSASSARCTFAST